MSGIMNEPCKFEMRPHYTEREVWTGLGIGKIDDFDGWEIVRCYRGDEQVIANCRTQLDAEDLLSLLNSSEWVRPKNLPIDLL